MSRRFPVMRRKPAEAKPALTEMLAASDGSRYLVAAVLLFAGSGCAALIYEIVWFQLLQLVIGSSAVSLGLLLAAYMGGLCLGSVALPRIVRANVPPLRVYALLELGIGAFGILVSSVGKRHVYTVFEGILRVSQGPFEFRRCCGPVAADL